MCVVLKTLLLLIISALPNKIRCDQYERDIILQNPFLQASSEELDPGLENPFLPDRRPIKRQLTFTSGDKKVTFHGASEENDYKRTQLELQNNPFLQDVHKTSKPTVVFHSNRPSYHKPGNRPGGSGTYLLSQFDSICGVTAPLELSIVHLIANGDTVTRHYPWLVAIYNLTRSGPDFLCGGTLISEKHMISAAHCFPSPDSDSYQFVVSNDLQLENRVVRDAKEIVRHPGYRDKGSDADIALVVFSTDVPLTDKIKPICLWREGINSISEVTDSKGLIAGWGNDENNQKSSALPKQAMLPIMDYLTCIRDNKIFAGVLGHNSFCAGYKKDTGACPGDSGSGLVIEKNGRWLLRGVVSATILADKNICQITDYTAMTDVARYSGWILKLVNR